MATKQEPDLTLTKYIYDVENRLVEVKKNSVTIAVYEYDGDGGRTTKTVNGVTTKFIGALYEENAQRSTQHVFLGGRRIASITNGNFLYYHGDHLGGTNVTTDFLGVQKELVEYEPFGTFARHEKFGTDIEVANFYFTGKKIDDETGLYYYGARYYDPDIGRFITADPTVQDPGNSVTLNRYHYAGNNPVNNIDPDGYGFWSKIGSFFKKAASAIVSVAFTFVGMPVVGAVVSSAINTAINGGNFSNFGIGLGVGIAAGITGGALGGKIGGFFGMDKAGLGLASLRGGLGGTIGGAGGAAIYKQSIWRGALIGAGSGVATAGAVWAKNDYVTDQFLDDNVQWDASVSSTDRAAITQGIKEAGQSPLGQRNFMKFRGQGRNLTIHITQKGSYVPFAGANEMYLNPNIKATQIFPAAKYNQLATIDMGTLFNHEFGHNLGFTDRYTPAHPGQSLNVSYNENPYRAWIGKPARTGYLSDGDVPFKRWGFQY